MRMPVVRHALAASAVLLTGATTPAAAQNVIDQQQPTVTNNWVNLYIWSAQTFTPGAVNVSGAGLFLIPGATSATTSSFTLSLWSGNPSILASQQLASQTVTFTTGRGGTWADAFWSPVAVIPGQTYWLVVGGGSTDFFTNSGPAASYANGGAYYNGTTNIRSTYQDYSSSLDLTFRTYTSVGVSAVPEPGTWALLGTGLIGVGGLAARRRRSTAV